MTSSVWETLSGKFEKAKKTGYWFFFCFSVESTYVNNVVSELNLYCPDDLHPSPNQETEEEKANSAIRLMYSLKSFKLARKSSWFNPFSWFSASPFVNDALEKEVFATISNVYNDQRSEGGQLDENAKKVVAVAQFLQDESVDWSTYNTVNFAEAHSSEHNFLFKQRADALLQKGLKQYRPKTSVFSCFFPCFSDYERQERFTAISEAINTFAAKSWCCDNPADDLKALIVSIKRASIIEIKTHEGDSGDKYNPSTYKNVFERQISALFLNPILSLAEECGIKLPEDQDLKSIVSCKNVNDFNAKYDSTNQEKLAESVEADFNERLDPLGI